MTVSKLKQAGHTWSHALGRTPEFTVRELGNIAANLKALGSLDLLESLTGKAVQP